MPSEQSSPEGQTSGQPIKQRRDSPWPLRIPKEWRPEIEAAASKREISQHAYLLKAIRRVLDGEMKGAKK